ncbi:cell division protein SepF [Brevibacterium album]|uniref:cell division protein SepF n=1 Tax=Brevibacterium album TaxID=417948 RepID=UPI000422CE7D|nr:cell division protein SepF [Brevibacterium album]
MSAMRKFASYLGFVEDEDELRPVREEPRPQPEYAEYEDDYAEADTYVGEPEMHEETPAATVSPIRTSVRSVESARPEGLHTIRTIHPRSYNDAKVIGQAFRDGVPVIMDLSAMDDANSKRLVDFSAGLIFGLHGSIEKITGNVFLLSPEQVTVTAEADAGQDEQASFFNQS